MAARGVFLGVAMPFEGVLLASFHPLPSGRDSGGEGSSLGSPQLCGEVAALPERIKVVGFSLANFALHGLHWFV